MEFIPTNNIYMTYLGYGNENQYIYIYIFDYKPMSLTHNLLYESGLIYCSPNRFINFEILEQTNIEIMYKYKNIINIENGKIKVGNKFEKKINHNNNPLTKINDNKFIEGYWYEDYLFRNHDLPIPIESNVVIDKDFIKKLCDIYNQVIPKSFYGSSMCRICKQSNGSDEYELGKNNTSFIFPSGLIHYYINHNVQPSKNFYEFIMDY